MRASFVGAAAVVAAFAFEFEIAFEFAFVTTALFVVAAGWQAVMANAAIAASIKNFVLFIKCLLKKVVEMKYARGSLDSWNPRACLTTVWNAS